MWPGAGNHSLDGRQQWLRDGGRWQQEEAQQEEQGQGLSSAAGVIVCVCGIVLILYFHINIYNYCHLCDRELSPPLSARPGHAPRTQPDRLIFFPKEKLSFFFIPSLLIIFYSMVLLSTLGILSPFLLFTISHHPPTSLFPQHKHKKRKKRNNFNKKKLNLSDLPDVNKGSSKMESVVW